MIIHYIEGNDGTRHVHLADCGHITFQLEADEAWEVELDDDATEDDLIIGVWADFFEEDLTGASDEELDTYAEMTVFRECLDDIFPPDPEAEDGESSGNQKADAFMDEAEAAGWDVEFIVDPDGDEELRGYVVVKARREYIDLATGLRNDQVLELSWSPTRLIEAHHFSGLTGDIAKKLSSVAGAIELLTASVPRSKPASARRVEREQPVKRVLKVSLPFDIEEAYDDEIISAVRGKKLIWWNDTAEDYDSATVIGKNHIKIETGTGGRAILTFCSFETGYRSVALETLVQVK